MGSRGPPLPHFMPGRVDRVTERGWGHAAPLFPSSCLHELTVSRREGGVTRPPSSCLHELPQKLRLIALFEHCQVLQLRQRTDVVVRLGEVGVRLELYA